MACTATVTVTVTRGISTELYLIKLKFLLVVSKILRNSLSVITSKQTARLQKGYSACAEGKVQWKFPMVTVTVTVVKTTEENAQSPHCFRLSTINLKVIL